MAPDQAPGYYRYKVGDYELTQLSDGTATFPMPDHFVTNLSKDRAIKEAAREYLAPAGKISVPFSPVLINTGSKLILVDTGYGPNIGPFVGHLPANLAAAGVTRIKSIPLSFRIFTRTTPTACTTRTARSPTPRPRSSCRTRTGPSG